jgi:hypothetical protein
MGSGPLQKEILLGIFVFIVRVFGGEAIHQSVVFGNRVN